MKFSGRTSRRFTRHSDDDIPKRNRHGEQRHSQLGDETASDAVPVSHGATLQSSY